MPFTVLYDANVLFPNALRDLLIRLAQGPGPFVRAKWNDEILDEVFGALRRTRPDIDSVRLDRTRALMNRAIRDVLVTGTNRSSRHWIYPIRTTGTYWRRPSRQALRQS